MAKYSDIKGFTVQTLSSDPAASIVATGSWTSGTSMPSISGGRGMAGAYHSSIAYGGTGSPPTAAQGKTEYFDGTSWTEQNDLNTARFMGCPAKQGTQTAALFAAGSTGTDNANVESWNGSSWSEVNDVPTAKHSFADGLGTQTAALAVGAGSPNRAIVSSWDGSNWTDVAELNQGRYFNSCSGSQTAGLCFAGDVDNTFTANTESWNGSTWTELNNLNTVRATGGGAGTQTSALMMTGNTAPGPKVANVEAWDGTSWTEVTDISTARNRPGSTGANSTAAVVAGGYTTTIVANVEEWETTPSALFQKTVEGQLFFNSTANAFKETISDAATGTWASVANLNVASSQGSTGAGKSNSAALEIGGYFNPPLQYYATVEQFDGSSWTEIADLNEGRSYGAGGGSITSALIAGGTDGTNLATTESWDGSSWTETGDFNNARQVVAGAIPSNADGIAMGGYDGSYRAYVETWNGSTWTETTDLNAAAGYNTGSGTSTAALSFGGEPTPRDRVESWNGSSWTEVAEINTARAQGGSSGEGTNTSTIYFGGEPPQSAKTELWNGSSWTEIADLATARTGTGGAGVATSAIAIGGNPGSPPYALAEAFTAALTNKTITTS
jgi:hypothetical protein